METCLFDSVQKEKVLCQVNELFAFTGASNDYENITSNLDANYMRFPIFRIFRVREVWF